jgi:hypothetical protein
LHLKWYSILRHIRGRKVAEDRYSCKLREKAGPCSI